ncbi:MAG: hypothetical protein N2510_05915 [Ignavibacteria bacterium]|nr:hypothetical protein [Ignavibacteria bacterium]
MPVSKDIFDLIKSMNRKEKSFLRRYLKFYSSGKEGNMLKLFENLLSFAGENETYDEVRLKKKMGKDNTRHFSIIKNNLYNLLLKGINEYHEGNSPESKVKNLIEQSDILYSRMLLKQSLNALKRAKKIAVEKEMFVYLHAILSRERILARYMLDAAGYESEIRKISAETKENLVKLKNDSEMTELGSRFTLMLQKYPTSKARDSAALNAVNEITEEALLQDEKRALSNTALRKFYNIKLVASQWKEDYKNRLIYGKKYSELVEDELRKDKASIHEYIVSLYSLLVMTVRAEEYSEYEKTYRKMEEIPSVFGNLTERERKDLYYYKGISIFSTAADGMYIEWAESALKDAEENHTFYEKTLSPQQKIVWYYVIARLYFYRVKFENCRTWLNRLISLPNVDLSEDYQCYARVMNLIAAYESGNPDLIEHALRMAYYFLTKRNKIYKYEKIILNYVRQAFRVKTEKEIIEMLEFMQMDLSKIRNDPNEENAFDAFNIMPWLESKINP